MFSWAMLISGNKLAEQIHTAVFGNTANDNPTENKPLRDPENNGSGEVKTLNS